MFRRKEDTQVEEKKYKTDCGCERNKRIKGVNCDVKQCVYHNGRTECYAEEISIGPCDANCSANTVCATFKPKEY